MDYSPLKTILIVEDDRAIAQIIKQILEESGFQCTLAVHGGEALSCIDSQGTPDLVILDWMMPQVSGEEFLAAFRRTHAEVPVVIISALDLRRRELPVSAVLQKPFEFRELLRVIRRCLTEPL